MNQNKIVVVLSMALTAVLALVLLDELIWPAPWGHITAVRSDPVLRGQYQIYDSKIDEWAWIGPAYHAKQREAQEFLKVEIIRHMVAEDGVYAVLIEDPRSKLKTRVWVPFAPDLFQAVNQTQGR